MSAARNKTMWTAVGAVTVLNIGAAVYTSRTLAHDGHAATKNTPTETAPAAAASALSPPSSSAHPAQSSEPRGAPRALPSLLADRPMDGIDMASVDRFWDTWKLVDVRYRSDNGEQRFVYVNDAAWKTMQAKGTHYPDGAMFGKLAFHTANDPAFPSSFEPRGFSRLQIMKKDAKAYPNNDGWGYAVITSAEEKDTGLPAEDLQIAAACHACHRLVPERDFVFSRGPFTDQGEVSVRDV
jgi:hypothetical protein